MNEPVVHALAVSHAEANVVGAVRLRCRPNYLEIELLRVGRAHRGFIFPSVADVARLSVPYTAIRALVRRGVMLHLLLDDVVATPHRHFALCRFGQDDTSVLLAALRWRRLALVAKWLLPALVAVVVVLGVPNSLIPSLFGRLAAGSLGAIGCWQALDVLVGRLAAPASSRAVADSFERDLTAHMGLAPARVVHGSRRAIAPRRVDVGAPRLGQWLGLQGAPVRLLGALAGALTLLAGSLFALQRMGVVDRVLIPTHALRAKFRPSVKRRVAAARQQGTPVGAGCECDRPYFSDWADGVPRMSILVAQGRGGIEPIWVPIGESIPIRKPVAPPVAEEPKPRRRRRRRRRRKEKPTTFDLAVVNNSTEPIGALDLVVTFARRDGAGRRRGLQERGLHWPRDLRPGEAVKWRVSGFGTEFKVDTVAGQGRIGDGTFTAAPADDFVALGSARLGVVRVHAAMMLAYLGDDRADNVIRGLMRLSGREQLARQRLLKIGGPIRACKPHLVADGLSFCVENRTNALRRSLRVTTTGVGEREPRSDSIHDLFLPASGTMATIAWSALDLPAELSVGVAPRQKVPKRDPQ